MGMPGARRDAVFDDSALPAGTVVLDVKDVADKAAAGDSVTLRMRHQTVATGTQTFEKTATVEADGTVRFDGLSVGSEWVYGFGVQHDGIPYESAQFQLGRATGKRVRLQVFPATTDIDVPPVGLQAFVLLEPRDEFVQVEQLFRFSNLGRTTWRFNDIPVGLPSGFKAFTQSTDDDRVMAKQVPGRGFMLSGYLPPGTFELAVRYQMPYSGDDSQRFNLGMPPRVGLLRVIAESTAGMRMRVEGLAEPAVARGNQGQRLLVADQMVNPGGDQIEQASILLTGIPTPGAGRWYAVILSLAAAAAGLVVAATGRGRAKGDSGERELVQVAKRSLLDELVELERAHKAGEVGPKSYARARAQLIDQLARLVTPEKGKA